MQPRVPMRRALLPGLALVVAAALAACASPSAPSSSASADPSSPPSASPEPTVQPLSSLDQPPSTSCALAASVGPMPDAHYTAADALLVELIGQGSDELAMAAIVGDVIVVTPSLDAGDPTDLVETAIARVESTGNAVEQTWVLGIPVDWTFDDLCAGHALTLDLAASGGDAPVISVGMTQDAYLEVGLLEGDALPQSVVDFDAQHPGIVRTFVDVQHFG